MRRSRGIALMEFVCAIGVVAIVASVSVSGVNAYENRARAARTIGDIGTISVQLYRWQSNTRKFPETLAEQPLRDLHGFQRRALEQLVAGGKDRDRSSRRVAEIAADSTHENVVLPRCVDRHRKVVVLDVIDDFHAR